MSPNAGKPAASSSWWNIPNQLTILRLILSVVVFALIELRLFIPALLVFLVAAWTDWLDGYLARRWQQVTVLGRILDPFADKIIVCGTFTYLAALSGSGVPAWLAVVVLGRELLITALRSFLEERGGDFSASAVGKLKMATQCALVAASLALVAWTDVGAPPWLDPAVQLLVVLVAALTIYSGAIYVRAALRMLA